MEAVMLVRLNTTNGLRRVRYQMVCATLAGASVAFSSTAAKAESYGYVISWFATATTLDVVDFKDNCPKYPDGQKRLDWYTRDLIAAGYTKEEATKIISTAPDSFELPEAAQRRMETRAIVNGQHVSIYNFPEAVPDPNIETVSGKYAYGFDLGSPNLANKFEDPQTHGKVDNQLWRAIGCQQDWRAAAPTLPYIETFGNHAFGESDHGWAIRISGDDLSKDGKVTVTVDRLTRHLEVNAAGEFMQGVSYVVDPSPTSHNVFPGEIKHGVLTITPGPLHLNGYYFGELAMRNTHMRISFVGDKLVGYWGGYIKWLPYIYTFTSAPNYGADTLGLYHAIKKMADADPDPKTGQNQEISSTWRMEAIPAYLNSPDGTLLASPAPQSAQRPD
jgi:hypothetical protein